MKLRKTPRPKKIRPTKRQLEAAKAMYPPRENRKP
jgi:hypothetical protein